MNTPRVEPTRRNFSARRMGGVLGLLLVSGVAAGCTDSGRTTAAGAPAVSGVATSAPAAAPSSSAASAQLTGTAAPGASAGMVVATPTTPATSQTPPTVNASASASPTAGASSSPAPSSSTPTLPTARFEGPADGQVLGKDAAGKLVLSVRGVPADKIRATVDGKPAIFSTDASGGAAEYRLTALADGPHTIDLTVDGAQGDARVQRSFSVDTTSPVLAFAPPKAAPKGKPFSISGTADPAAKLTANGKPVRISAGKWMAEFAATPRSVRLIASDPAGNITRQDVAVQTPLPLTRAVHMTARAWGYKPKREAAMALLKARKINAIQVDIKDEDGLIGYESKVALATTAGAVEAHYDAKKMIAEIHAAGGRVIGRLVAFRDPALTKWAWTTGRKDMVLQGLDGQPYTGSYGDFAFPNFAHPEVQKYNVDLALEAAKLGFDDVLYDYIRRPDGKLSQMKIPGLVGTAERSVADTVAATRAGLTDAGVSTYLGVSVFGIAATRPTEIAQDIALMAPLVDYVAPMVYPSHWAPGEYKVADPNNQPYDIVNRSLKDFQTKVRGTNAAVVPWLQDFSLGVKYGPDKVRAQIKASVDDGIEGFLLWNASANYQAAALDPIK